MGKRKGNLKVLSLCCGADAIANMSQQRWECIECHKFCDTVTTFVKDRKMWNINPVERVVPNKKKKSSTKLTDKELKEIHQSEDF